MIESNSKQTRVCEKLSFCCFNIWNSEIGKKLDERAEIEEKNYGNSEMLPPYKQCSQNIPLVLTITLHNIVVQLYSTKIA